MSRPYTSPFRWSALRGYNTRDAPQSLPDDIGTVCDNVELDGQSLGRRRPTAEELSLTSGPSTLVYHLYSHYVSTSTVSELWAFSGNPTAAVHRRVAGTWSSVSLIDTPALAATLYPICATLNDKNFIAYDSASNRLHVWDPVMGVVRRVGISKSAPPTVADTGAGAYPATTRVYRVGWRIKNGADIQVTSELSDIVGFTPSGAGTAARVTKPATPDSATHWVLYGFINLGSFPYDLFKELAEIAVGTTTYDDSTLPSAYTGDAPMPLGTNIPPPSARYLLAADNRLLMAGAFETTAASGETTPLPNRVWFTRVLGTTDEGDDESIPNTTEQKNWIDVGPKDGDRVVGLGGPIDGIIYVFKFRAIWRLIPTGIDTQPYVADRLTGTGAVGANTPHAALNSGSYNHRNIVLAEDETGQPMLYFVGSAGLYRLSPQAGMSYMGWDLSDGATGLGLPFMTGCFMPGRRQLWFTEYRVGATQYLYVFTPQLASVNAQGIYQGGWQRYSLTHLGVDAVFALETNDATLDGTQTFPVVGGQLASGSTAFLVVFSTNTIDDTATGIRVEFPATITSKAFQFGLGVRNFRCGEPVLERTLDLVGNCATGAYGIDWHRQTISGFFVAEGSQNFTETHHRAVGKGITAPDAVAVSISDTWITATRLTHDAISIPFVLGEWIVG